MEQAFRRMVRLNTWLKQAEKALGCICLGALFVVMITNAGLRYCLQSGLNWSDELNQFLFVWMGEIPDPICYEEMTRMENAFAT